jgi:carboxypeptidase Taq
VKPSLIRVDADEVTYPLHVILRYEIEKKLFNGEIKIRDLPQYWNELMVKYLGISTLNNDKDGVMQDVHWSSGAFGYFPAYTLGRLIASQLFQTCLGKNPHLFDQIRRGDFGSLKSWLSDNVYSYASSLSTTDFLKKVTGEVLNPNYFVNYLKEKYLREGGGMNVG